MCRHGFAVMRNQNPPQIGCFVEDIGVWCADNPSSVRIHEIGRRLTAAQAQDDFLVEVRVSLEPRPHAPGAWRPVPGILQLGIKRRMLTSRFVPHTCELGPSIPQVSVDALSIRKVKCDGPEHLFQTEGWERFDDSFRRLAAQEGIYNGVK